MSTRLVATSLTALMLSAGLVAAQDAPAASGSDASAAQSEFSAQVSSADGTNHGTVTVTPTASGHSLVNLDLQGLPAGTVAVHLHQTGACDAPDFESAGGHLAAEDEQHGVMVEGGPHVGDLPNLHVPDGGAVMAEHFAAGVTAEMLSDEDGTAFIIHGGTDDYESQPSGDAGDRIACGVLASSQ